MRWIVLLGFCVLFGCNTEHSRPNNSLFTDATESSGITFRNDVTITPQLNPYTYRNFYNGAGVAIGDINNDGLQDIYFAANQTGNKLYLNRGNFTFEDITDRAGVSCGNVWSSGVTFADINGDGYLDIYVCKSGDPAAARRYNELFINNGDLTFTERSKEYGLDVVGLSVQAAFFDYDRDGDLDCYLLTNSFKTIGNFDLVKDQRKISDPTGQGNKFFINENGVFKDRTTEAGIYSSAIGFGLGITLGDFNNDRWTDLFISNDFFERDYLYINDQHGGFVESLPDYFESISMGSMGADFADLDNDGQAELFVTEMLPDSLSRKKSKTVYENWNKHQLNLDNGYHHQYSRNVLQTRIGESRFAEVGRFAGVAATEWSWGALLFDMDNDGLRDIFVANGIYKDLLDRDYLAYSASDENIRNIIRTEEQNAILKLIDLMPVSAFPNYAFKNRGGLRFENVSTSWGFERPAFSSGSAYADLDNDGDLDLVINNLNDAALVYRNNASNKSLSLQFGMAGKNRFAIGTHVTVYVGADRYTADNFVTRGFQSSVPSIVTVGIGSHKAVDSIHVQWPDGEREIFLSLPAGRVHKIEKGKGKMRTAEILRGRSLPFNMEHVSYKAVRHQKNGLVDFNR
ncbi:MAG TPA: CRTAC1 family protein, partial [Chryseosolibacter sp.]